MSETETNNPEYRKEQADPLGYLIIPVFLLILVGVVFLWMNQKNEETKQEYFPVSGSVTLNKKPLQGNFQINFHPINSTNPTASAILEADGTFELISGQEGITGAKAGEYQVCVIMLEGPEESWRIKDPDPKTIKINPKDGGTIVPPDPDPPFDKDYSNRKKSPVIVVIGEIENVVDIDLPLPTPAQLAAKKAREKAEAKRKKEIEAEKKKAKSQEDPKKTHP